MEAKPSVSHRPGFLFVFFYDAEQLYFCLNKKKNRKQPQQQHMGWKPHTFRRTHLLKASLSFSQNKTPLPLRVKLLSQRLKLRSCGFWLLNGFTVQFCLNNTGSSVHVSIYWYQSQAVVRQIFFTNVLSRRLLFILSHQKNLSLRTSVQNFFFPQNFLAYIARLAPKYTPGFLSRSRV